MAGDPIHKVTAYFLYSFDLRELASTERGLFWRDLCGFALRAGADTFSLDAGIRTFFRRDRAPERAPIEGRENELVELGLRCVSLNLFRDGEWVADIADWGEGADIRVDESDRPELLDIIAKYPSVRWDVAEFS